MTARRAMPKHRRQPDWTLARELYELEGLSFTAIGRRLRLHRTTVAARAKREAWVSQPEIVRQAAGARREALLEAFIARDREAILENLGEKHRATRRILALVHQQLDLAEEDGAKIAAALGGIARDPITNADLGEVLARQVASALQLRRLTLVVSGTEVIDRNLAGLKDEGWRGGAGGRASLEDEAAESAIAAALAELERSHEESEGRVSQAGDTDQGFAGDPSARGHFGAPGRGAGFPRAAAAPGSPPGRSLRSVS